MRRNAVALLVAGFLASLAASPAASARQLPCAGDNRGRCLIRPHQLYTGAHTYLRGIHWRRWGASTAIGIGKLVEVSLYAHFVKPARIRLRLPAECRGREWFWSETIRFGAHFRRPYLRDYNFTPCANERAG